MGNSGRLKRAVVRCCTSVCIPSNTQTLISSLPRRISRWRQDRSAELLSRARISPGRPVSSLRTGRSHLAHVCNLYMPGWQAGQDLFTSTLTTACFSLLRLSRLYLCLDLLPDLAPTFFLSRNIAFMTYLPAQVFHSQEPPALR